MINLALGKGEQTTVREQARRFLAAEFDFDLREPVWRDSCPEPVYYDDLIATGRFSAASGNALLVGDAAGLIIPLTGEGIGTAIVSGVIAARCIAKALEAAVKAESSYERGIQPLMATLRQIYPLREQISQSMHDGPESLARSLAEAWEAGLRLCLERAIEEEEEVENV